MRNPPLSLEEVVPLLTRLSPKHGGARYFQDRWLPCVLVWAREGLLSCRQLCSLFLSCRALNIAPVAYQTLVAQSVDAIVQLASLASFPSSGRTSGLSAAAMTGLEPFPALEGLPTTADLTGVTAALTEWQLWDQLQRLLPAVRDIVSLGLSGSVRLDAKDAATLATLLDQLTIWGEPIAEDAATTGPGGNPPSERAPSPGGAKGTGRASPESSAAAAAAATTTAGCVLSAMDPEFWVQVLVAASEHALEDTASVTLEQLVAALRRLARIESELAAGPSTRDAPLTALEQLKTDKLRSDLRVAGATLVLRMGSRRELLQQPQDSLMIRNFLVAVTALGIDMAPELFRGCLDGIQRVRKSVSRLSTPVFLDLFEACTALPPDLTTHPAIEILCSRLKTLAAQLSIADATRSVYILGLFASVTARGRVNGAFWFWPTWDVVVTALRKMRTDDADKTAYVYRAALLITCILGPAPDDGGRIQRSLGEIPRKWLTTSTGQWLTALQRTQARSLDPVESEIYQDFLAMGEGRYAAKGEWRTKDRTLAAGEILLSRITVWRKGAKDQISVSVGRPEDYVIRPRAMATAKPPALRPTPEGAARDAVLRENGWVSVRVPHSEWLLVRSMEPGKRCEYLKNLCQVALGGDRSANGGGGPREPRDRGGGFAGDGRNGSSGSGSD